jgi:CMP-N-acetylneuraminic acid synthetase
MSFVAFIFARGGSKGLPGKNIRLFAGKPLIAHAIEHAKAIPRISRVIVSTDSEEIAKVSEDFGAEVPFLRPPELAKDDSAEWLAWRHAISFLQDTVDTLPLGIVSVPTTSPLRIPKDIDNCIDKFLETNADMVITMTPSSRNPFFNMVKPAFDGSLSTVLSSDKRITRRQDAPRTFDITTLAYVFSPNYVMSQESMFSGRVFGVEIPSERSIDIDSIIDFKVAEFLFSQQL